MKSGNHQASPEFTFDLLATSSLSLSAPMVPVWFPTMQSAPLTSQAGTEGQGIHERQCRQTDVRVLAQVQKHRDLRKKGTLQPCITETLRARNPDLQNANARGLVLLLLLLLSHHHHQLLLLLFVRVCVCTHTHVCMVGWQYHNTSVEGKPSGKESVLSFQLHVAFGDKTQVLWLIFLGSKGFTH